LQIKSGADTVQLFDSWAGLLPEPYFSRWVIGPTKKIVEKIRAVHPALPIIGFPRQAGALYPKYAQETGVSCVGIDSNYPIATAIKNFGGKAVQGNLDPVLLLAGGQAMVDAIRRILDEATGAPFVFNLGHGVIKETPPEHVALLAQTIRNHT